jgi:hypothetical protein
MTCALPLPAAGFRADDLDDVALDDVCSAVGTLAEDAEGRASTALEPWDANDAP